MPAPVASVITSTVKSNLSNTDFPTPYQPSFEDFLTQFGIGFHTGWSTWQLGLLGGRNNVTGLGIGAWTGVGSGGNFIQGVPVLFTIAVANRTSQFTKFETAVVTEIAGQFATWASTFLFSSVPYVGTSTATVLTPGVFTAIGATPPAPIGTLGAGTTPLPIKPLVKNDLQGQGWNTNSPQWKTGKLLDAIDSAISTLFTTWMTTTLFAGDTVTGPSLPPVGAGTGTSLGTGVLA